MSFASKMKTRRNLAILYIVLGAVMVAGAAIVKTENDFLSSFGLILAVMGLARFRQYRRITRNEESLREQEIRETDERNVMLIHKARSLTFSLYVLISSVAVIVLSLLDLHTQAQIIGYSVLLLVAIYWITYFILKKRC